MTRLLVMSSCVVATLQNQKTITIYKTVVIHVAIRTHWGICFLGFESSPERPIHAISQVTAGKNNANNAQKPMCVKSHTYGIETLCDTQSNGSHTTRIDNTTSQKTTCWIFNATCNLIVNRLIKVRNASVNTRSCGCSGKINAHHSANQKRYNETENTWARNNGIQTLHHTSSPNVFDTILYAPQSPILIFVVIELNARAVLNVTDTASKIIAIAQIIHASPTTYPSLK